MTTQPTKLLGLLGMAKRAGKLCIGFDAGTANVENGKCHTLLLSCDCSPKTAKECAFVAEGFGATVAQMPLDKMSVSAAIGLQKPVAVLGVLDDGFAKAIRSHCTTYKEETSL